MDQQELDRQYTPSLWSKRLPSHIIVDRHVEYLARGQGAGYYRSPVFDVVMLSFNHCVSAATAQAQEELRCEVGVCYDEESAEVLDIYYPTSKSGEHKSGEQ